MNKITLEIMSCLILWLVEILKQAKDANFDFSYLNSWIMGGLGAACAAAFIGIVFGGFVLFNIFLFFYNIFKPDNKLKFSTQDKVIAGTWTAIIFGVFSLVR